MDNLNDLGLEPAGVPEGYKDKFKNQLESLGRGSVAGALGVIGDLRELDRTIGSYLPKALRDIQSAASTFANPGAAMLKAKAPSSEKILDHIPRITDDHEYSDGFELAGGFIGPGVAIPAALSRKAVNTVNKVAGNNLPPLLPPPSATPPAAEVSQALRKVKPPKAPKPQAYQAPRNEMGFYSALDEAVGNIQSPKGTGEQYLKQLLSTPGVKKEELEYRGLDDFLRNNEKTSLDDIKKYLSENEVKLEQKTLRGMRDDEDSYELFENGFEEGNRYTDELFDQEFDYYMTDYADEWREEFRLERGYSEEDLIDNPDALREIDELVEQRARDHAYESAEENAEYIYDHPEGYTVRGNDNFGEWRVEDPNGRLISYNGREYMGDRFEAYRAARDDAMDRGLIGFGSEDGVHYDNWKLAGADDSYRENLIHHEPKEGEYGAPHFDGHSENLLMHNRFSDRIDADGKNTLYSEEMQSDWLQQGRNKGFATPENHFSKMPEMSSDDLLSSYRHQMSPEQVRFVEAWTKQWDEIQDGPDLHGDKDTLLENHTRTYQDWVENQEVRSGIPDAPFKKTYHEFLAKKSLNDAAEGGYDRFAWSPGKIQAERYGMSHLTDDVRYYPRDNMLRAYKDGTAVVSKQLNKPEDLDTYLGAEFAKRLRETGIQTHTDGMEYHGLAGEPVDISDKRAAGMRNFYDEKIPNFLSSHLKKYGVKPGTTQVQGKDVHYVDITPEMREDFTKRGQPMFAVTPLGMPMMDPQLQSPEEEEVKPTQADIAAALRYIP